MDLLRPSSSSLRLPLRSSSSSTAKANPRSRSSSSLPKSSVSNVVFFTVRSCLPFPPQKAKYHRELQAAVDVVEKACHLCVDVKKSLFSTDGQILEKDDQTPVTVADFSVQALISLELHKLFPSIPLVAEEDSTSLTSNNLVDSVVSVVTDKAWSSGEQLARDDILKAIDRGGKGGCAFGATPATYWVLDPIDGTRGFLKGSEALYVVGLALVVEGEITLGVMGCPNWLEQCSPSIEGQENKNDPPESGTIMVSHVGCGTWRKRLSSMIGSTNNDWIRCFVDKSCLVHEASFCISDSQTWDSLPLSDLYSSTTIAGDIGNNQVLLLRTCCGSLCKYLMVASGRATVFLYRAKEGTVIKAWDHAVGVICVKEAGGQVTDWGGSPLDLAADQSERRIIFPPGGLLVSNGNVHNQILEIISSNP